MTGLGAALYGGFFGLAALWLFLTSDAVAGKRAREQYFDDAYNAYDAYADQAPERSNSTSFAAADEGSSPELVSQASSK